MISEVDRLELLFALELVLRGFLYFLQHFILR